ncbi:MAG: hypothetical protein H0T64_09165 [Pyrinomonadaceae bacterium]|nr:hypothetical protein [Pyrinomonadaceae bacterium]
MGIYLLLASPRFSEIVAQARIIFLSATLSLRVLRPLSEPVVFDLDSPRLPHHLAERVADLAFDLPAVAVLDELFFELMMTP